jgi:hypothetical protein
MWIEQKESDFSSVETGALRDDCEWRRLIGGWPGLRGRHDMARLAPSMSDPQPIARIDGKNRPSGHYRQHG